MSANNKETVSRQYKPEIFALIFKGHRKWALELYNALMEISRKSESEIRGILRG